MSEEAKKVRMVPLRDLQIAEEKLRILESALRQIASYGRPFFEGQEGPINFGNLAKRTAEEALERVKRVGKIG